MLLYEGADKPPLWFYVLLALVLGAVWYMMKFLPAALGWWVQ